MYSRPTWSSETKYLCCPRNQHFAWISLGGGCTTANYLNVPPRADLSREKNGNATVMPRNSTSCRHWSDIRIHPKEIRWVVLLLDLLQPRTIGTEVVVDGLLIG